jgi:hypothetical protein
LTCALAQVRKATSTAITVRKERYVGLIGHVL